MILDALVLNNPMVLMCVLRPASPKARMACGVLAKANKPSVALFTLTSVACADKITAMSNSKGE